MRRSIFCFCRRGGELILICHVRAEKAEIPSLDYDRLALLGFIFCPDAFSDLEVAFPFSHMCDASLDSHKDFFCVCLPRDADGADSLNDGDTGAI